MQDWFRCITQNQQDWECLAHHQCLSMTMYPSFCNTTLVRIPIRIAHQSTHNMAPRPSPSKLHPFIIWKQGQSRIKKQKIDAAECSELTMPLGTNLGSQRRPFSSMIVVRRNAHVWYFLAVWPVSLAELNDIEIAGTICDYIPRRLCDPNGSKSTV